MMNSLFKKLTKFYGLNPDEYEYVSLQCDLLKIRHKESKREVCLRY